MLLLRLLWPLPLLRLRPMPLLQLVGGLSASQQSRGRSAIVQEVIDRSRRRSGAPG